MVDESAREPLTLSNLPPEIHLVILSHLPILDYYHLKLVGCKRLTHAVREVTGRLSQRRYTQELQAEDARRNNLRAGFTRSTMEIMIERGQTTLVHRYIRKYHSAIRRPEPAYRYLREKRVFHSALHWAVYYESESIVLLLLDQIDVRHGHVGASALHIAAAYGKSSMVELLLANRAEINALDANGKTPFQLAIENGAEDVACLLREKQAAATLDEVVERYPKEWPKLFGEDIRMRSRLPLLARMCIAPRNPEKLYRYFRRRGNGKLYASLREYFRALYTGSSVGRDMWWFKMSAFQSAIIRGCEASVSVLLEEGAGPGLSLNHGGCPDLQSLAVSCDQQSILRLMFAHGADPKHGFFEAAAEGDTDRVRTYLKAGTDINTLVSGKTVLHHAVSRNDSAMVKFLINHGADVEAKDPELKRTPVFEVCSSDSALNSLPCLLQAGANINAQDVAGNSPAREAVKSADTTLISILLQHGANLSLTDDNERVGLFLAAGGSHAVEHLLDAGVDINAQDNKGRTKLHLILSNTPKAKDVESQLELARLLLHRGANVNLRATNFAASTPFQLALRNAPSLIHDFIQHGADVNVKESKGCLSALHIPFLRNEYDNVRILLDHGADPHERDENGRTLLHNAFSRANRPAPNLLKLILDQKVDPNAADNDGMTPIQYAIRRGTIEHISLLLEHGARLDATDPQGNTPLHRTCLCANPPSRDKVELLLDHGADINARDNEGRTALHLAIRWVYEDGIKVFLEHGADVDAQDIRGQTPLHYIAESPEFWAQQLVDMLLDKGARVDLKDEHGCTAVDIARKKRSELRFVKRSEEGGANETGESESIG